MSRAAESWVHAGQESPIRSLFIVFAYLAAWVSLDLVAVRFETAPEVSIWYPPSALDIVLLLAFGLRYWPALLLNTLRHVAFVSKSVTFDWRSLLAFDVAATAAGAGAAFLLARTLRIDPGLRRLRDVLWFVAVAVLAGPFCVAAIQVGNLTVLGSLDSSDILVNALQYFAGDATGVAMLAPVLLVLARAHPATLAYRPMATDATLKFASGNRGIRRAGLGTNVRLKWTVVAEVTVFITAVWAAFGSTRPVNLDYSFFVWIPLVWIPLVWFALRYGFARTTVFVLAANLAIALLTVTRFGSTTPFALQFGLLTFTITGLLIGAATTETWLASAKGSSGNIRIG